MSIHKTLSNLFLQTLYEKKSWISDVALNTQCHKVHTRNSQEGKVCRKNQTLKKQNKKRKHKSVESFDKTSDSYSESVDHTLTSSSNSDSESDSEFSSESNSLEIDLGIPVFKKKFTLAQLYLWARIRTQPVLKELRAWENFDEYKCVAITQQHTQIWGAIDILQDSQGYMRKYCQWANCAWILDPYANTIRSCEFFHEALMGIMVQRHLSDIPVFERAALHYADLEKKQLHFALVPNGEELDSLIFELSLEALHSVIFQILVSICIAQERIQFKHHDLHLGNVMLTKRTSNSVWTVNTKYGKYDVPLIEYDATLIDFGLSSCMDNDTEISRIDSDLLCLGNSASTSCSRTSGIGKSWGVWDPELKHDTGYDFAMFIESILDTLCDERPLPLEKLTLMVALQKFSQTKCTDRNRPIEKSGLDWESLLYQFLGPPSL